VYVGSQFVHRTTDGGQTWQTISPDLTKNDPAMMGDSGGLTMDNLSVEYAGVVFSIAESPLQKGLIWAGTNDGQVQVTRDGGAHWENVTKGIPNLPANGTVGSVEPSRFDAGTCYISVDLHQVDNRDPFLFKTADFGRTWKSIVGGIPKSPLSYTHVLREDPVRRGLLYAGTENALYVSFDDGTRWEPLQTKLPHAPVHWLTIQEHFRDLVVGTYGRGFYILDDVTPLQQISDKVRASSLYFFEPRPAYRFRAVSRPNLARAGANAGKNAPYGAILNYWLGKPLPEAEEKAEGEKKSPVELTILDASGAKIRTLRGTNKGGVNRVVWDLRYEPSAEVKLRTTPGGNPHVWEEKRFRGKDRRDVYYYGTPSIMRGPLVPPGTYTVKLQAGGQELTQNLTVRKDPNSAGSEADVAASTKLSLSIYRDTDAVAGMINRLEWTRKQVEDFRGMLAAGKADAGDLAAADALEKQARAVEDQLLQPTLAEADLKSFRGPLRLYMQLLWLQAEAGSGGADVSGNADFPPTKAEEEVYALISEKLSAARRDFDALYGKTIPDFNERMGAKGYVRLMTVEEPAGPRQPEEEEEEDPADDWGPPDD
jgi:hypothetical protein